MKNITLLSAIILTVGLLNACNGDHATNNGKDTQQNGYHVQPDTSKINTSKVTDPSSTDNSASGGAQLVKDTAGMKRDSSKK